MGENGMHVVISSRRLLCMSVSSSSSCGERRAVPEGPGPPPVACSA